MRARRDDRRVQERAGTWPVRGINQIVLMLCAIEVHIAKDLKADGVPRKEGIAEQICFAAGAKINEGQY